MSDMLSKPISEALNISNFFTVYDIIILCTLVVVTIFLLKNVLKNLFIFCKKLIMSIKRIKIFNVEIETKDNVNEVSQITNILSVDDEGIESDIEGTEVLLLDVADSLKNVVRDTVTDTIAKVVYNEKLIMKAYYYTDFKIDSLISSKLDTVRKSILEGLEHYIEQVYNSKITGAMVRKTVEYKLSVYIVDLCVDKWKEYIKILLERNNLKGYLENNCAKIEELIMSFILYSRDTIQDYTFPEDFSIDSVDFENVFTSRISVHKSIVIDALEQIIKLIEEKNKCSKELEMFNEILIKESVEGIISNVLKDHNSR